MPHSICTTKHAASSSQSASHAASVDADASLRRKPSAPLWPFLQNVCSVTAQAVDVATPVSASSPSSAAETLVAKSSSSPVALVPQRTPLQVASLAVFESQSLMNATYLNSVPAS